MSSELAVKWNELMLKLGGEPPSAKRVFNLIIDSYNQPPRAYHNLSHLSDCLANLAHVSHKLVQPEVVEYALWFHDIVCASGSQSNEYLSAAGAVYAAKELGLLSNFAVAAGQLILLTNHHDSAVTGDACYLLDIDLAVLGRDWTGFLEYESKIREEYNYLSEPEYKTGRRKVLEGFLARSAIFRTEYFWKMYEQPARENLACLITLLNKGGVSNIALYDRG